MRVKTGETVEVWMNVDVQYRCSSCGEENFSICSIKDSAYTPTVMGFNLDRDISGTAKKSLYGKYDAITNSDNLHRFRSAGFTCSCSNCGNIEPWANVNYEKLEKIQKFLAIISVFSILSFMMTVATDESGMIWIPSLAITVVSYAIIFGITKYISKVYNEQLKLIAALPQESLPTVLPHSAQRYSAFKGRQSTKTILRDITRL